LLAGGAMTNKTLNAITDGAAPIIRYARYRDVNADGTVETIDITTSVEGGLSCTSFTGADDLIMTTFGDVGLITATNTCATPNGYTFTITMQNGVNLRTGGATDPVLTYVQPGNGLEDDAGNDVLSASGISVTDSAPPIIIQATYSESVIDGKIDRLIFWTTNDFQITCANFNSNLYLTVNTPGDINLVKNPADSCTSNGTTNMIISLATGGDADKTGLQTALGTEPTVTYTTAPGIADGNGNEIPSLGAPMEVDDGANPVIISVTPSQGSTITEADINTNFVLVFSEMMDTAPEPSRSLSPAAGTLNIAWSNDNKTLTIDPTAALETHTNYTLTVAATDNSATNLTLVGNVVPLSMVFNGLSSSRLRWLILQQQQQSTQESIADQTLTEEDENLTNPMNETDNTEITPISSPEPKIFGISVDGQPIALGSLVKSKESRAVYYMDALGLRHVFPNNRVYESWYGSDFSQVLEVSEKIIATFRMGRPVSMRPGRLIKIQSDPNVYLVTGKGLLRHITSETLARELFGDAWNTLITDVDVTLFVNYQMGEALTSSDDITLNDLLADRNINDEL
jgi:hypothetical protein